MDLFHKQQQNRNHTMIEKWQRTNQHAAATTLFLIFTLFQITGTLTDIRIQQPVKAQPR